MRAIVQDAYGPPEVLELRDVERPQPGDNDVLVRVRAASANPYDWHFMRGIPYFMRAASGLRRPKNTVLGSDVAGRVEEVGCGASRFRPGDEVIGFVGAGGFAEHVAVPEEHLGLKPETLTFEQASAVPLAGLTALQGLRDAGGLEQGQSVLIIGAGGGVGTFAVQIGRSLGAHVTGVCSTTKLEMVRSLGADHVIDYTGEDYLASGRRYDIVLQLAGTDGAGRLRRALTPRGTLVLSSGDATGRWIAPMGRYLRARAMSPFVSQRLLGLSVKRSRADMEELKMLIEAGEISPVVGRTYPLSEATEAMAHLEEGHAAGKIVIDVD